MKFNLSPLQLRHDIAMLEVLHRAALGFGPPQLCSLFRRSPGSISLIGSYKTGRPPLIRRSEWGLIPFYNALSSGARNIATVKDFQWYLQERMKSTLHQGLKDEWKDWTRAYSPR